MGGAIPDLVSFIGGGMLSQTLGGQNAEAAARILFCCAGGLLVSIAVLCVVGPKWMFEETCHDIPTVHFMQDIRRIVRYWPIYPVMLINVLWNFGPIGIVLQYQFVDHWHGTDTQWGLWVGIFKGSLLPIYMLYGWLSQRIALRTLLWVGMLIGIPNLFPLMLVHDAVGALIVAAPMGLMAGLGSAALLDLAIRSAPRGCQGTIIMMFFAFGDLSGRAGDLLLTWIYDKLGGLTPTVAMTTIIASLILPLLLLVPKRLTATRDGEVIEEDGAHQPAAL